MRYFALFSALFLALFAFFGCAKGKPGTDDPAPKWISRIVEYRPAPGQFANTPMSTTPQSIVGGKGGVSLGGFGGYIIFAFHDAVQNIDGSDFVIHGNSFAESSEAGAVCVSVDANGNGVADDVWYELRGSEFDASVKGYRITYHKPATTSMATDIEWTDNMGASGAINANEFHKQSYWPLLESSETIVFEGNLVKNAPQIVNNVWISGFLKWGYADNFSSDYESSVGGDPNTAMSNKFDIANAVDGNGVGVVLTKIDFIKVYNCQNEQAPLIGDISTDICGALSLTR